MIHAAVLALLLALAGPASAQQSFTAVAPIVTATAANNKVILVRPGSMLSVTATNSTSTAGFVLVLNATSSPGDGTMTPLACAVLPASGSSSISSTVPLYFSTGITVVLSSAADCFTKTTGTITGFISGMAQ